MKHSIATIAFAAIALVLSAPVWGQSEQVKQIAHSFAQGEKQFQSYATDLLVNQPDYLVFTPKQNNLVLGDTYNDHFQVIAKDAKRLFAFWTQATREADIDQHIAFSKSVDGGLTWTPVRVLAGSPNKTNPQLLASWQQPMISKTGRIYVLWNQQTTNAGPHCGQMFGIYSDNDGDTWTAPRQVKLNRTWKDNENPTVPPQWCNWQRPLRLGEGGRYLVGCSRHGAGGCSVEFWQYDNIDENPEVDQIHISFFSTGPEEVQRLVPAGAFGTACEEAAIVKLPDGRLFALMRTDGGYPYWTQSRDQGKTWDRPAPLKDRDGGTLYLHPRSPCPLYDWKGCEAGSGYYFALVHNTFDFAPERKTAYQNRGPLYLIAGKFDPKAQQPIQFAPMKLFAPRKGGNSFYTSYTFENGQGVLWFPDHKFFLCGRTIGPEWFDFWK